MSHRASSDLELDEVSSEEFGINDFPTLVFPSKKALKSSPPEVPIEYGEDFREARLVFDISPKSSAALCRRLLQRIIHVLYNIKRRDLQTEIQELIDTINPPSHLSDQLQTIRVVGNFAAHPMKNQATGEIHDVEPGEADWMIATVENFMDFAFVQPARSAALKAAINAKLVAAGKPLLP